MRKKLFTFLLALTASIGMMWAETVVVINKSEFTSSGVTKEGVTLALSNGSMTSSDVVAMNGSFEFSTSLGKFTGITIETDANIMEIYEGAYTSAGWPTGDNLGTSAVWTGESETVLISCMVAGMNTITITCTIEPAPVVVTANTLQLVADPTKGSVAVTNLLGSGIVDNGDGTYDVPEGAEVTLQATPNEGYEFIGWKAGSVGCDFTDCGNALSTVDNPLTFDMYQEAAFMAEFAAVAPQPQIGPKEVLDLGTTGCVGEHYQLTGGGTNIYRTVGGVDDKMITIESLHGEIIDNISLKLYYYNVWTGYSVAASSGDVSSWNYDAYEDLVITNINATSVTLSRVGSGQENGYVMFEKVTINNSDEPTPQPEPEPEGDGKLTGAFTINADGDQILFSKGNLQYQASTTTFRFATNQYDMIGADNANISDTYTGWIDLFGWGTGNHPAKKSTEDEDYSTFVDWGTNAISNGGNEANLWRTLTIQEWGYLIKTRTNADNLKGQATVAGVHGYVLLPDSWTLPAGLSFTASPNDWTTNVYTAEQWAQMEAAGAVFLPATGYRDPDIKGVGEKGWYWSSTVYTDIVAYDFEFTETNSRVFGSRPYFGQPVRLVTAAPAVAPQPTTEEVITNEDPENPSYHYSTFFHSTQNYKLTNDGTQAFIADLSGSDLVLTKIAEGAQVIPANTAVILRKSGSADPVVLTPTEENGVSVNPNDNSLEGVDAETAITSIDGLTATNCYVLSGTDQYGVGFYRINSDNLKAHKAYVKYAGLQNNAPRRMRFVFNQEQVATGIDNANADIKAEKRIENGQVIIIRDGVRYNVMGAKIQ